MCKKLQGALVKVQILSCYSERDSQYVWGGLMVYLEDSDGVGTWYGNIDLDYSCGFFQEGGHGGLGNKEKSLDQGMGEQRARQESGQEQV